MNLAKYIKGDVLMSVGLEDQTCPPSTGFAAYNHISAHKEMRVYEEYAHETAAEQDEEKLVFIAKRF